MRVSSPQLGRCYRIRPSLREVLTGYLLVTANLSQASGPVTKTPCATDAAITVAALPARRAPQRRMARSSELRLQHRSLPPACSQRGTARALHR